MYNLAVNNNYNQEIAISNGQTIPKGQNLVLDNMDSVILTIPGMGDMNLISLGEKKLDGYPEPIETWGLLIRYKSIEAYYRYEGQGKLKIIIDNLGTCKITTTNGKVLAISLPELVIG